MVEQLDKLCILDLTDNQIRDEGLPMSLARLTQLKAIGLKKNCLTRVPRMLGYMQSLQEIYLEENADLEVGCTAQSPGCRNSTTSQGYAVAGPCASMPLWADTVQMQSVMAAAVVTVCGMAMDSAAYGSFVSVLTLPWAGQDLPSLGLQTIIDWKAAAVAELQVVSLAQVTSPLDFLLDLPNLRSLMMGKLSGAADRSMYYMLDFQKKLLRQWQLRRKAS